MYLLADNARFESPLFWAVVIGWIISVTIHEFAHGLVGFIGGDFTVPERGALTLNPFKYVNPTMTIVMPILALMMGGIPLPGGATFIRRDLLRNKWWGSAVSLAGPLANFLMFLCCTIPLLPRVGWVNDNVDPTMPQQFLAASAVLQFTVMLLNLVPIPPLDGFQALAPAMPAEMRKKLMTPPVSTILFIGFFIVMFKVPQIFDAFFVAMNWTLLHLGGNDSTLELVRRSYNTALFGYSD